MLSGITTYLFGPTDSDENGDLLAETTIQGLDGEDWILVEVNQQKSELTLATNEKNQNEEKRSLSLEGKLVQSSFSTSSTCYPISNGQKMTILTSSSSPSTSTAIISSHSTCNSPSTANTKQESSNSLHLKGSISSQVCSTDHSVTNTFDATNTATNSNSNLHTTINNNPAGSNGTKKKSSTIGTMEGSWFVTPPPCFINNHNQSSHKKVSVAASPLEDILIEHPSISVFHSHSTITESQDSGSILGTSLSNVNGFPQNSSALKAIKGHPQGSLSPSSTPSSSRASSASRQDSQSRTGSLCPSSPISSLSNQSSPSLGSAVQRDGNQGQAGTYPRGPSRYPGPLEHIINWMLPMQRAAQEKAKKYQTKSFINRQNLVMHQSNRRPTRRNRMANRPSGYSNNRKMC